VRIVSLLPAATDLVVTLGLAGDLVGRTRTSATGRPEGWSTPRWSPARRWATA
jgi:ABC-type hemin transport system substrate-binding protein